MKDKITTNAVLSVLFSIALVFPLNSLQAKANLSLTSRLKGKILLQVEGDGEAWYLNPKNLKKYFLGKPEDFFESMQKIGVGISNSNIAKIPVADTNLSGKDVDGDGLSDAVEDALGTDKTNTDTDGDGYSDKVELLGGYDPTKKTKKSQIDLKFSATQKGKMLIQSQRHGEAWYVNPSDGKRYFLGQPLDASNVLRSLAVGITNADLAKIRDADIIRKVETSPLGEEKQGMPPVQVIEDKAGKQDIKDCGENEDCFKDSANECKPAKLIRSVNFNSSSGTQREDSYLEIQGVQDGVCILYAKTTGLTNADEQQKSLIGRSGVCKIDLKDSGSSGSGWAGAYGVRDILVKTGPGRDFYDRDMRPYTCSGAYFEPVKSTATCSTFTGFRDMTRKNHETNDKLFKFINIDQSNNLTAMVDDVTDVIGYLQVKSVNGLMIKNLGSKGGFITVQFNCN